MTTDMTIEEQLRIIENWTYSFSMNKTIGGKHYATMEYTSSCQFKDSTQWDWGYEHAVKDAYDTVSARVWEEVSEI